MNVAAQEDLIENLSPFELSLFLEKRLQTETGARENLLNAGRGNPNWTAPIPREAFFCLDNLRRWKQLEMNNRLLLG